MRPGIYAEDVEYVPPTESDLAPMPKNSKVKADNSQTVSAVTNESYVYEFIE